MNKFESKYHNTAIIMNEALIQLLTTKDYEDITIKELCEKAGVNRSTFYSHYDSMSQLLDETLEQVHHAFLLSFHTTAEEILGNINQVSKEELVFAKSEFIRPYLNYVKFYKAVYKAMLRNPAAMKFEQQYRETLNPILTEVYRRFGIKEDEFIYWSSFFISGTEAVIREWIQKDCVDDIEKIENILIRCVLHSDMER